MTNFSFTKRTRDQFRDWKSLSRERISREKNKCSFILKIQRDILFICLFWKSQTNQIAKFIFAGYSWNHWTSLWQQSIAKITITILKSVLKSGLLDTSSKSRCDKMIDSAFFFFFKPVSHKLLSHIRAFPYTTGEPEWHCLRELALRRFLFEKPSWWCFCLSFTNLIFNLNRTSQAHETSERERPPLPTSLRVR